MSDQFISNKNISRIDIIDQDHSKREKYRANLKINNDENKIYHAIKSASINDSGIFSSCIYTNIKESRQNSYLKLIFIIYNLFANYLTYENATQIFQNTTRLVIIYNLSGNKIVLNDWDNLDFFSVAFFTFFPYSNGGHIATRSIKIYLPTWAN